MPAIHRIFAGHPQDRNAAALYDLRTYDPDLLATIGRVLTETEAEAEAATEG